MDPGRRDMIENQGSFKNRSATAPRFDPNNRARKATRPDTHSKTAQKTAKYLSQDEQSRQFVADEDKFVLKQSKKKADIRVREGRAKPIDHLAFNLRYIESERDVFDDDDGDIDIELQAPATVVENLGVDQLNELQADIGTLLVLETDATNRKYWEALQTLCGDRKSKLDPQGREDRVLHSVAEDIDRILSPKTYDQLEALEKQIRAKLRSNENIDADYWEQLLCKLFVCKSKATLTRIFQAASEARAKLFHEQRRNPDQPQSQPIASDSHSTDAVAPGGAQPSGNEDASQVTKALYDREAARGISENEEIFTAEEAVPSSVKPQWTEKYRARKPRYFNRVQMGYEWNKYNQTHYDHDNPPPKVVQGYKFNIFYPDLIDVTKAPTFKIIREHGRRRGESHAAAGEADTCLIHFIAGPPYEDIAFRIVDREWDYSAKRDRGFRSTFDKGILQLHFQFKKIFYRK
ncbi:cactin domain-containing protein [Hirsutella rhossiliensis]|uniref:Splicing factor Cactin n=1 Tax=Hirsutella rhossiliensis TaxID=111463 RepID=A0A9P8MUB6_9HYPO|nr:cactin domain-containing protein [Hirsutella rhossiliensis]KAH0962273.1 cactin domain-containing protein [Hirsutella rhossiliensis]